MAIPKLVLRFAGALRLRLPHILYQFYWVAASKPKALGMVVPRLNTYVVKTLCSALHNNYSSIEKLQELHPQEDQNPQIPDCAGTSFINVIYTRLVTFPSRKIS